MSDTPRTDDWYERERVDPTVSDGDRAYMEALQCGKGYANKLERELSAEKAAHHQTTLNWMSECESAAALTVRVGQLERDLSAAEIDRIRGQVAKLSKIRQIASNAIYFDDNSDYGSALCDICRKCGMTDDEIGREYIEDASLAATEDGTNAPLDRQEEAR